MSQENKSIRPEYYNTDSVYEPIKIIQHYGLCFEISNVLKYCLRAGLKNKDTEIEDLVKAKTYLQLRIDYLQAQKELTINIKCENNISPVLKEMHEKVLEIKKELPEDELAIEKFMAMNKQYREEQFKPFVNSFHPKKISELKVGDEIKAIDPCLSNDYKSKLTIGKSYKIQQMSLNMIRITNDLGNDYHWFLLDNLDKYFHVTK